MHQAVKEWEEVGRNTRASWYLDPVVAEQKRRVNQQLVRAAAAGRDVAIALKTDVFEEANGDDQILFDLLPDTRLSIGMDLAAPMASRARDRCRVPGVAFLATDVRCIALATGSVDLVVSNSTLDHFEEAESFYRALREIARVLRPGGAVMVTLDNPWNPLYPLLRWASRTGWIPFRLGYTASIRGLAESLEASGLRVTGTGAVIHNPRMISTLIVLGVRKLLGRHADGPLRLLLRLFDLCGRLPTRWLTACYVVATAEKPPAAT